MSEPEAPKADTPTTVSESVSLTEPSKTGVYIDLDSDTRKVVTDEPKRGIQLLAPGTVASPDVRKAIERAELASAGASSVETATTDKAAGRGRRGSGA